LQLTLKRKEGMKKPIRILIVEDKAYDADLAKYEIRKTLRDCEFQVAETRNGFIEALKTFQPDVILSDYTLPHFDGMKALKLALHHAPLTPLIIWTGSISEDVAVDCVKAGANNYILKDNLKRLGPAIIHALEEKELLSARKQAEQKYQSIFENSMEGIFQSSPLGHYLSLNPAMARLYGYASPKEMLEAIRNIAAQIYVEPEKRSEFISLLDLQNSVENFEARNYCKDESIIWTSTSARAVRDPNGNILYYEGFVQDITQRKRVEEALQNSEKRFRALIENGLDDISLLAVDGTLLWESPSTIRNLGYAPGEFVGHNIFELMHPEDLEWTRTTYAKLLQEPGNRQRGIFRLRRSDGTWRWMEAIATNMLHEPGVNAIVINYRDITEQKQAEIELQQKNADLALVNALNEVINRGEGVEAVVNLMAKEIRRNFSAEGATVYLLDQTGRFLTMRQYFLSSKILEKIETLIGRTIPAIEIPVRDGGYFHSVMSSERGVISSNPKVIQTWMEEFVETSFLPSATRGVIRKLIPKIYKLLNIKSIILVPLFSDGKAIGLLDVSSPNLFTEEDLKRIENIGRQLTIAIRRKQVEDALRESQARYQNLVETSHDLIWSMDTEARFTFVNRASTEIYGYEPEELIGRSFFEIMDPKHYHYGLKKFKETIANVDELKEVETNVRHRDGRQIILSANSIVLRDEYGNITGVVGSSHDITIRKQVEDILKEERNLLRTLIDNIPDRIYAMDIQGRKTLSNIADWKSSGGKTMEDVIGKTDFDTYPPELAEEFWRLDQAVLNSGQAIINYEEPGLDADGNLVSILTTKIPLRDDERNVIGLVGIGRDITERKHAEKALLESEQRYRALFEDMPIAIWEEDFSRVKKYLDSLKQQGVTDFHAYFATHSDALLACAGMIRILNVNNAAVQMYQAESKHQLIESTNQGLSEGEAEHIQEVFADLAEGRLGNSWEGADETLTGKPIEISLNWSVVPGNQEDSLRIIVTTRDITERKQTETERQALMEIMQGLANTKDLQELLKLIHGAVAKVVYAENFFVILYQPGSGLFEEIYSVDQYDPPAPPARLENSITSYVFRSGEPLLLTQNLFEELATRGEVSLVGTDSASWLGVPLKTSGRTIGVMAVQDYENDNRYLEHDKDFLASIAAQAALAIEHKQAEEALRESEEHYRTIFEGVQDAIFVESLDGKILMVNERACEMFGYSQAEFLTKTVADLVPSADSILMVARTETSLSPEPRETLNQRANGEVFPIEISGRVQVINREKVLLVVVRDITERKRAEDLLRDSEERFSSAFEHASIGMALLTTEGRWFRVNWALCRLLGYLEEELLQKTVQDITYPDDLESDLNFVRQLLSGEIHSYQMEKRYFHKLGHVIWVLLSVSLVRDHAGKPIYFISQIQDITERKKAERDLSSAREFLQGVQDSLSAHIAILDQYGKIVQANTAWRAFGEQNGLQDPNHCIGVNYLDICDTATGADAPEAQQVASAVREILTGNRKEMYVEYPCHSPEEKRWFVARITCFHDGEHNWAILAHENITIRKQVEESLREEREKAQKYLNTAGVLMLALDGDGIVTLINQKGCEILGYSAEEIIGKKWIDTFLPKAVREELQDVFQKLISDDIQSSAYYENSVLTKSGEERLIAWHNTLLRDEQGRISSSLSSGEDITERKRAEAELRASEERFRQLADNIQEAFWMTDAENDREVYMSPAAERIWGRSIPSLMYEPNAIINTVFSEDRPVVLNAIEREKSGEKMQLEYRIVRPDGTLRWIWDRAFPIFDDIGRVRRIAGISADITERRESELALVKSQNRYRELFDSSPISIWEEDFSLVKKQIDSLQKNGVVDLREYLSSHPEFVRELASMVKITDVNKASLELYGIDRKEDLLHSLGDLFDSISIRHFADEIVELMSPLNRFSWEGTDVLPTGRHIEILVNGSIPHGYEEDWSKVIVSIIDITERKEAAEKLRESEDRYHSLFQNQLHGSALHEIITNDQGQPVDYIFLKVNPAFEKMTGLKAQDILGRQVTEVLPGIENEGLIQIYGQVALTGQPVHINDYVTPLGRYYEINGYTTGPRRFAVSFMDVTERRQAEQELRKLSRAVEQSGSTIVITDTSGSIEYVNPKFTQITGYSYEEVIGQNPRILKSGFTPDEEYKQLWQTISSGNEWHGELLNKKKDGTLYWESVTISPIMDDRKEITHYVGVKEDITERKQNESETRRHIAELEAVYENGLSVGRLLEPGEIGNRVIETFARYLPWHHVTIRLRKEGSNDLELIAFNVPDLKEDEKAGVRQYFNLRINKVGQGLSGWVIQTGAPLRTGNVQAHLQYVDTHSKIQSGLYMPLKVGERVIGVISVESEAPNAFTEQDERLLATLANQTAVAFENARLYEAMQKELSERKRVEDALRNSETHYRALADSITDILFELDQELHYIHWNKASETLTGIPAKDAIGKPMEEIFRATDEQAAIRKIYEDVLSSHQPRTFETILLLGGEKRFFEINAYPSTRGVSVVAKDVTDRKRTETIMQKRFELMEYSARHSLNELMQKTVDEVSELTGSPIGFFHFMDEDQVNLEMQTWSTNTLQLFRVSPEDGTHLQLDQAGVWADAVRQRRPLIQNDYESLAKKKGIPDGHVPIVREIVIPIIRNERIMAVMGIGNKPQDYTSHDLGIAARMADYAWDITERKQMEIALEVERNQLVERVEERTADLSRANSNLARALRVKDEFLANMSHELRTPLNAILGLSESLGEQIAGPLNEKQQKYISTISESGHHLLSLINDILDLAKIEAGQITLDINKVDIHSVCQASLRMIKQLAQKKNQEVSLEIDNGLGLMWADERRLKQMIVNLLGNAVKFTPDNGKLGLEVRGDEEANQIAITVWDNGIGIKQDDLARLFQPFIQLDSGLAREATGTGLGLALVAQMARLHGGSVNAVSEAGKGSRFTIVLPWEPALAIDTASRMRITGKFRAIQFDEKNKPTILLVEDTKEVVMMLKDYLELAGYEVFTAQDGIDGIVQARHVKPDLILMDIQMPRMDGFETTRKLRSDPNFRYTPIIALTALAMPHDRERCLEAGMDEYISKPVNLKALIKIIQSCLFEQEPRTR
jgi:PAS domain S-box-containing protein